MRTGVVAHLFYGPRVLLVLRDNLPHIHCPNTWDSITETLEPEGAGDLVAGMRRGLLEEIGIVPENLHFLGLTRQSGHGFFFGTLSDNEVEEIVLGHEGQRYDFFLLEELEKLLLGDAIRNYYQAYPEVFQKMTRGVVPKPEELRLQVPIKA